MWAMTVWERDEKNARRCPCGLSLGGTSEREINERMRDIDD